MATRLGSTDWTRKCETSPRWRTLPNGQIEVEGQGVPLAEETGYNQDRKVIQSVWEKWKHVILPAAAAHNIPPLWILAIIIIESKGTDYNATHMNGAGYGGLMGMGPQSMKIGLGRPSSVEEVIDPALNVMGGAGFMAYNMAKFGAELPIVMNSHNAGSPKCSATTRGKSFGPGGEGYDFDGTSCTNSMGMVEDCTAGKPSRYGIRAVMINNSAIEMGLDPGVGGGGGGMVVFVAAVALGAYFAPDILRFIDDALA